MKHIALCLLLFVAGCSESETSPAVSSTESLQPHLQHCPKCNQDLRAVTILIGFPSQEMVKRMEQGEALLGGCMGDSLNPETAFVCDSDRIWKTAPMLHWQPLPERFNTLRNDGKK